MAELDIDPAIEEALAAASEGYRQIVAASQTPPAKMDGSLGSIRKALTSRGQALCTGAKQAEARAVELRARIARLVAVLPPLP